MSSSVVRRKTVQTVLSGHIMHARLDTDMLEQICLSKYAVPNSNVITDMLCSV